MTTELQSTPTPKFITLNCSGGISLGAYMAGVFYELTKEAVKPNPKIIIDVITGASAGAMTGVIAAYYLLGKDTEQLLSDDYTKNVFYQAWVKEVDVNSIDSFGVTLNSFKDGIHATIDSLKDSFVATIENYGKSRVFWRRLIANKWRKVNPNYIKERQRKQMSILSGEAIEKIARLVGWQAPENTPPSTEETKPLALLMTITNLQGLLETVKLTNLQGNSKSNSCKQEIKTITSAETRLFLFQSGLDKARMVRMWHKAVNGGLASGAFPAAFPPIWDKSDPKDQRSRNLENLSKDYFVKNKHLNKGQLGAIYSEDECLNFLYTDGGILNGLPLLKGIDVVKDLGSFPESDDDLTKKFKEKFSHNKPHDDSQRLHVYIQPIPVENLQSAKRLTQGHFSMFEVAFSGLTLPKAEHDSIRLREIEKRNKMVKEKDRLLEKLGNLTDEQLKILDKAVPYQYIQLSPINPAIISRISEIDEHHKLQKIKHTLRDKLQKNNQENLLQEGKEAKIIAADFLGAFGGFFDKKYREHDFLIGRICGLAWLHENCGNIEIEDFDSLINDINDKLLDEDPTPASLKPSQKIRITRVVLRALRVLLIEATIVGLGWLLFLGIGKLILILFLAILEILASLALVISDLIEKLWAVTRQLWTGAWRTIRGKSS